MAKTMSPQVLALLCSVNNWDNQCYSSPSLTSYISSKKNLNYDISQDATEIIICYQRWKENVYYSKEKLNSKSSSKRKGLVSVIVWLHGLNLIFHLSKVC